MAAAYNPCAKEMKRKELMIAKQVRLLQDTLSKLNYNRIDYRKRSRRLVSWGWRRTRR